MSSARRPMLFPLPQAGWKEFVSLPRFSIGPITAKLDTGARTAALHADHITVKGDRVTFAIENDGKIHKHTARLLARKRVRSSNGHTEERPVIETTILLGGTPFLAEVTLTDRTDMGVPMLLGRATLKSRFLVNPAKTFLLSRRRKAAP